MHTLVGSVLSCPYRTEPNLTGSAVAGSYAGGKGAVEGNTGRVWCRFFIPFVRVPFCLLPSAFKLFSRMIFCQNGRQSFVRTVPYLHSTPRVLLWLFSYSGNYLSI